MGCLDNIVGLSQTDCECFTEDRPANWNVSKSGIYLDELDGLSQKQIETGVECGEGSIWDLMTKALANGERKFRTDLLTKLRNKFKDKYDPFEGLIGFQEFNSTAPQLKTLHGIRLESNCIKGSVLVLKNIVAFFDTDLVNLPVKIYRSDSNDPIEEFTINATALKKTNNVLGTPIELPLWIDAFDTFYYSIVYELPVGVKPLNTRLYTCSCKRQSSPWSLWVYADGIKADAFTTVEDLDDLSGNTYTYGLSLGVQIQCKKAAIICEDGHEWDFDNDDIALNIAHAIQEISGVKLINEIISRPDSAHVAINEEQLQELAVKYAISYEERVQYLAANMAVNNDCFTCSDQIRGIGILA